MSHLGAEFIFGPSHIVYFISLLIFGFAKIKNEEIVEGRLYFLECQKII